MAAEKVYGTRQSGAADISLEELEKALLAGKIVSYAQGWPSGPTIILAAGALYLGSLIFGRTGGLARSARRAKTRPSLARPQGRRP